MHLLRKKYYVLTLIIVLFSFLFFNIDSAVSKQSSKDVVELYINALSTGDLDTIKKCLGQRMQKRRQNTLDDASYSNFLIDYYSGATFRIISEKDRNKGKKAVDVEITFKSNDIMTIRLILNGNNKIVDEIIL